jgi:hypothetical protein
MTTEMVDAPSGIVILYDYLWAHQADRGEDSGRKSRPCCVHVIVRSDRGPVSALFPITSRPAASRAALSIPETELRRVNLSAGYVVVDELNLDDFPRSPYVADPKPLGTFSAAFMRRIRTAAAEAVRSGQHRSVPRRR